MSWLADVPDWTVLPALTLLFVAASLGLVMLIRPVISRAVNNSEQWNHVLGYTSGAFSIFYGILLALVALAVYENYTESHTAALQETTQLAALYRGTNGLPDDVAGELQQSVLGYVRTVIDDDWTQQAAGRIPTASRENVVDIEQLLYSYDPQTVRDDAKYQQLLATFDDFIEARGVRIDAVTLHLPGMLWFVIWVGAVINAVLAALFAIDDRRLHLVLAGLLALFVALVIIVTADMDHPYAGAISVGPEDFQRLLEFFDN